MLIAHFMYYLPSNTRKKVCDQLWKHAIVMVSLDNPRVICPKDKVHCATNKSRSNAHTKKSIQILVLEVADYSIIICLILTI